jgi:hypothetical protein
MAWQIAEMIVKDITSLTLGGNEQVHSWSWVTVYINLVMRIDIGNKEDNQKGVNRVQESHGTFIICPVSANFVYLF